MPEQSPSIKRQMDSLLRICSFHQKIIEVRRYFQTPEKQPFAKKDRAYFLLVRFLSTKKNSP